MSCQPCRVTRRHVTSCHVTRHSAGNGSGARTGAAPGVHEGAAEVEIGLVLVVGRAAQLDVVRVVAPAPRERIRVMKLHVRGRVATTSPAVHVAAAPAVTTPHGPPQRRGNAPGPWPGILWRCVARWRSRTRPVSCRSLSLQGVHQQNVDRATEDRRWIPSDLRTTEQILQRAQLLVRLLVHRDLDLVTTRQQRRDRPGHRTR